MNTKLLILAKSLLIGNALFIHPVSADIGVANDTNINGFTFKSDLILAENVTKSKKEMYKHMAEEKGLENEMLIEAEVADQQMKVRSLAHKMMGEINLAKLALDTWQPIWSQIHIDKAIRSAKQLLDETEQNTIYTTHKYGKFTYSTQDETKDYYVPVLDDILLVSDYENIFDTDRKYIPIESDAKVIRLTLSVDLRETSSALQKADKAIDNENYDEAKADFNLIFKNSIVDEIEIDDPLLGIHDNLALAKAMLDEKNYSMARIALKHAQKHLKKLEKSDEVSVDSKSVTALDNEIADLQKELSKKDPTTTKRAKQKLSGWMGKVKSWF